MTILRVLDLIERKKNGNDNVSKCKESSPIVSVLPRSAWNLVSSELADKTSCLDEAGRMFFTRQWKSFWKVTLKLLMASASSCSLAHV